MKAPGAFILLIGISTALRAQNGTVQRDLEVSAGLAMLIYQSVYSFQQSTAFETVVRGHAIHALDWQVGARMGVDRMLPDVFVRLLATSRIGAWAPFIGVEGGYTNRGHFREGNLLLRESRQAMESDISHFYMAGHSAPLSFNVSHNWRISVFEIHIGTHPQNIGRTLRLQAGLFSLARTL